MAILKLYPRKGKNSVTVCWGFFDAYSGGMSSKDNGQLIFVFAKPVNDKLEAIAELVATHYILRNIQPRLAGDGRSTILSPATELAYKAISSVLKGVRYERQSDVFTDEALLLRYADFCHYMLPNAGLTLNYDNFEQYVQSSEPAYVDMAQLASYRTIRQLVRLDAIDTSEAIITAHFLDRYSEEIRKNSPDIKNVFRSIEKCLSKAEVISLDHHIQLFKNTKYAEKARKTVTMRVGVDFYVVLSYLYTEPLPLLVTAFKRADFSVSHQQPFMRKASKRNRL